MPRQAGEPAQLWGEDLCWKEPPWVIPSLASHLTLCPPPQTRCSAASWSLCASARGTPCPALCGSVLLPWTSEVTFPPASTPSHRPHPASPALLCPCLSTLTSTRCRSRIFTCSPPHLPGLDVDGIYRVSGNLAVVQKLRFLVDRGEKAVGRWSY